MNIVFIATTYEQIITFPPGGYSLSVRDNSEEQGHLVRHYKIHGPDSGGYYINPRQKHPSLISLVEHHKSKLNEEGDQVQFPSGIFRDP